MGKWLSLLIFSFSLISTTLPVDALVLNVDQSLIINEIRLGGTPIENEEQSIKEYVTLFNASSESIPLDGWILEYAKNPKAGLGPEFCSSTNWKENNEITVSITSLSGELLEHSVSSPIEMQLNDTGSGVLRLVNTSGNSTSEIHDLVGWGAEAPCFESNPAPSPTTNWSYIRKLSCENSLPQDTNDNSLDFVKENVESPAGISKTYAEACTEETDETIISECEKIIVTEILPNALGTDFGKEFIELHNPTEEKVSLVGCSLNISGGSKPFVFNDSITLFPNEYKAFYDSETGLVLPNSSGGEVLWSDSNTENAYPYPSNMKEDFAWALIDNEWQQTNRPTPGQVNLSSELTNSEVLLGDVEVSNCPQGKYRNPATNRCKNIETVQGLTNCPVGKTRNPETNRCRTILSSLTSVSVCRPGQERNPETNRCRSTAISMNSLSPCKPNQERNPETNRCRKITEEAGSLKPCDDGQERNEETNRCRKVQATLAAATDYKDPKDEKKSVVNYGLLAIFGAAAIGFGVYEYRHDFGYRLATIRNRITNRNSTK